MNHYEPHYQNGSSTYRGAGGISEHLILWPVWQFAGTHGGPGGPPDGGFILFLFPSLLSLKIKDLYPVCFLLRNSTSFIIHEIPPGTS